MASRSFNQFLFSLNPMLTYIQGNFSIGSSGAVSAVMGNGVSNVVLNSAGCYSIQLQDQYNRFLGGVVDVASPVTGAEISISGSSVLTIGNPYVITTLGTSSTANWVSAGLPSGVTPALGVAFPAAITGSGTGTGKVKAVGVSGIAEIEFIGDANTASGMVNNSTNPYVMIQLLAATNSSTTTLIAANAASGSVVYFSLLLRNSSLAGKGE